MNIIVSSENQFMNYSLTYSKMQDYTVTSDYIMVDIIHLFS